MTLAVTVKGVNPHRPVVVCDGQDFRADRAGSRAHFAHHQGQDLEPIMGVSAYPPEKVQLAVSVAEVIRH